MSRCRCADANADADSRGFAAVRRADSCLRRCAPRSRRLTADWTIGYRPHGPQRPEDWGLEAMLKHLTDMERYSPAVRSRIKQIIDEERQQKKMKREAAKRRS